ncbi:outer membrane protein insertion porin family [Catalinimonas alkaloidigena]|uniref:BamA/OMP85 family outer membrane protein n=1 Tax=Catalinimonas alkaloidigena TaxID=1075417 RepID=UPI002404BE2C|nr:POTRA domain-containing protein [Catalinimonas alkaloidigena]MDF9800941.1 outer membrane protein insertion porin family [Catalinimonas alkaloidigena]
MKKLPLLILTILCIAINTVAVNTVSAQIGVGRRTQSQPQAQTSDVDYAEPQEYEIAEITVAGAKVLNENALISLSGLEVGDRIMVPGPAISDAIKKLWKQKILGDIKISYSKIEGDKIHLVIELAEKPRLSKINLTGINSSQETEITEDLTLIRGQIVDDALINRAKNTVAEFFIDKGYLNVEVEVARDLDTLLTNNVVLNIDVDKKEKVKIKRINIRGDEVFSEKKLEGKMKNTNEKVRFTLVEDLVSRLVHLTPSKAFNFLTKQQDPIGFPDAKEYLDEHVKLNFFNGSKFIEEDYEADKKALIDFYNSKGYRDAVIVSDSIYKSGENTINVDITVNEGQRYYFRDIIWTGNYIYDNQTLARVLGIEKGDVYDLENLNKRLNFNPTGADVSSLYMDNGYLFFNVQPVEVSIEDDSIDVEMRIFEGEQATISKIIISGNDRTNDHVIRREIRTVPGQKFSRSDLIRTQRELSQLGYFDPEQIGINPIPNPADGTVDIEYKLVERPSDQIELSGGWGGYYGFVGTLGLVFNNFSVRNIPHFDRWRPLPVGDGQKLSLRIQSSGRVFQSYSATFSEPWLGGRKPHNLTIGLSRTISNPGASVFYAGAVEQSIKISNASIGIGRRVKWPDDFFTISNTLQFRQYDTYNYNLGIGLSSGTFNNFSLSNVIARNSIDSPMFPRRGSSISLEASFTPPYSWFKDLDYSTMEPNERYKFLEYHRWMFDAKYYMPLAENLVLNMNMHFGLFGSYGAGINSPFERFSMGGAGMAGQNFIVAQELIGLRGYPDNRIEPVDPETGVEGGIAYNKYALELRYLISPNPSATIYVLGFVEGGNNFSDYNKYNPFDLYKSAGVGARIFMPAFGLLGIDWGYGFDELTYPSGEIRPPGPEFHFRIGQQIR